MNVLFIIKTLDFIESQAIMLLSALAKSKGHMTFLGMFKKSISVDKFKHVVKSRKRYKL